MKQTLILVAFLVAINCLSLQTHPTFSNKLQLEFDYAVTEKTCFYSAQFQVFWNGKSLMFGKPWDYELHSASFKIEAKPGRNTLMFAGRGHSDGRGVAVGNIKLLRDSSYGLQDLACNGDFSETYQKGKGNYFKIFKNSITGWKGKQIQVGYGQLYNNNWPVGTIVSELDANQNTEIEQAYFFLDDFQVVYEIQNKELAA